MTRPAKIALLITAAVVACVVAACGVVSALKDWVPGLAGCADPTKPAKTSVITEKARIEQMYPALQPIRSVHWQEHEARPRRCPEIGPMTYEMNGLAVITEAKAAELFTNASPAPAPDIPADLQPFAPAAPSWQRISPELLLDRASATVYFTHSSSPSSSSRPSSSSPGRPSSPPPS